MATFAIRSVIDGQPALDRPWQEVYAACVPGGAVKVLTPLEAHTDRQRRWVKGVLLPSVSDASGYSRKEIEIKLIAAIFPEDITYAEIDHRKYPVAPSISSYGKRKMSTLIEESVPLCWEWGFDFVTYPDPELRS